MEEETVKPLQDGEIWVNLKTSTYAHVVRMASPEFPGFVLYDGHSLRLTDRIDEPAARVWLVENGFIPKREWLKAQGII